MLNRVCVSFFLFAGACSHQLLSGCLTTVSTFANEIYFLAPKYGYLYAIVSVVTAQLLLLPINIPYWSNR